MGRLTTGILRYPYPDIQPSPILFEFLEGLTIHLNLRSPSRIARLKFSLIEICASQMHIWLRNIKEGGIGGF